MFRERRVLPQLIKLQQYIDFALLEVNMEISVCVRGESERERVISLFTLSEYGDRNTR